MVSIWWFGVPPILRNHHMLLVLVIFLGLTLFFRKMGASALQCDGHVSIVWHSDLKPTVSFLLVFSKNILQCCYSLSQYTQCPAAVVLISSPIKRFLFAKSGRPTEHVWKGKPRGTANLRTCIMILWTSPSEFDVKHRTSGPFTTLWLIHSKLRAPCALLCKSVCFVRLAAG